MSEIAGDSGVGPVPLYGGTPTDAPSPVGNARPEAEVWQTVAAGRLAGVRRLRSLLPFAGLLIAAAITAVANQTAAAAVVAAVAVLGYGTLWLIEGRNARSWRYRERADDLLIDHGLLFRRQIVVPYGRMQFVDVKVDPLDRVMGIATVQLHTAAAASDARIPGLRPEQAQALRDRLAQLGQARMSGL